MKSLKSLVHGVRRSTADAYNNGDGRGSSPGHLSASLPTGEANHSLSGQEKPMGSLHDVSESAVDGKQLRGPGLQTASRQRWSRLDLIWVPESRWREGRWVHYVPTRVTFKPKHNDILFVLQSKRLKRRDKPQMEIVLKSEVLKETLRAMLGDDVFFQDEPEVPIRVLFFRLSELKRKVAATELQMRQIEGSDDIRDCAETLGIEKSLDPNFGAEDVARYLTGAMEELHILLGCLSAEFEPVGRSLALYRAHGQITFDLLIYEFEKEQLLVIRDENGDKNAFVIEKAEFQDNHIPYSFSLSGHGWKWNGTCYMKDMRSIHIEEFPGTRGLSSLPFSHLEPDMKVELEHRGELYTRYAPGIQYIHNHGKGKVIVKSIHEIIRYLPSGRAMIDIRNRAPPELDTDSWVVEARPRKKASHKEEQTHMTLPSDLLYLLPPTVQGFSLASKEFGRIRVVDVGPVKFDENAWDHLVLDPDSKTLIRSLVEVTQSSNSATELITDVITGKGGGLVGVLHGSPGTGKTLTAEAVAEHLRRPLYMVSAGELSLDAPTLEKEFKGILQRATDWDAVLLIDEADVFLEQRSNHELHRNSIVSVTLRLLEYHRGVMFLTTNRISAFDQAFLSRFSIAIRYPDLDFDKRRVIWQRFLALAGITQQEEEGKPYVSAEDIDRLAARPFNGRSVKNLVRTAQALALAENVPLAIRHIEVVASVSEKFLADFADMKSGAAPVGTVKEG